MKYILYVLLMVLSPFVFALTQRDLWREAKNPTNEDYKKGWHNYQFITMVLVGMLGGVQFALMPWYFIPGLLFILWTLSDGIQNLYKNEGFWTVNTQSKDAFMPYSQWYNKVPLICVGILIAIFGVYIEWWQVGLLIVIAVGALVLVQKLRK